jgi:transcriptional regulator with XRE-family HTH domain
MDKLATLAERLTDAMGEDVSASDLARACNVSPAAVSKWLDGRTKDLKADTLAAAARALGVRDDWLRTGRLPRERTGAQEDRQVDQVISILEDLRAPLAALATAIDALTKVREPAKKPRRA